MFFIFFQLKELEKLVLKIIRWGFGGFGKKV